MKKNTFKYIIAAIIVLAASCSREQMTADPEMTSRESTAEGTSNYDITVSTSDATTKSVLTDSSVDEIRSLVVIGVDDAGFTRMSYVENPPLSSKIKMSFLKGRAVEFYALANMGDVRGDIPIVDGVPAMQAFRYKVPSFDKVNITGVPMSGRTSVPSGALSPGEDTHVSLKVERLFSKVNVTIDKRGITGASAAMPSGTVSLRQVNRTLSPFGAGGSVAKTADDIFAGESDYYTFSVSDSADPTHTVTLYVPENNHGELLPSSSTQDEKSLAGAVATLPEKDFLTYIEYTATKQGSEDGVSADLTYRVYMGKDATGDFSVIRGAVYNATLSLSWDGLMWKVDGWRLEAENYEDSRAITISKTTDPTDAWVTLNTKKGAAKVGKDAQTEFFINYFVNGHTQSGRKDLDSWPYGWVIYIDGIPVETASSGTIKSSTDQPLYNWTYDSDTDKFTLTAVPGTSVLKTIHTLQVKTKDGCKSSDIVYFMTLIPFEFQWQSDGQPNHVAQRGVLQAIDSDTHAVSDEAVFHLKDGFDTKVRMTDNRDGTAIVELIDGFVSVADAISIRDADDDRECLVPMEARIPWFDCTSLTPATNYIDAQGTMTFSYLQADAAGAKTSTKMKVVDNGTSTTEVAAGTDLDLALVNELLAPALTSNAGRLGFDRYLSSDGTFTLYLHVHTYEGVAALITSAKTFTADSGRVFISGHTDRGTRPCTFVSWNPWYFWYQGGSHMHSGGVMNDYTLYHEPNGRRGVSKPGWEPDPQRPPTETTSYHTEIQNAVVSRPENLKLNARFQADGGYLGHKVATGQPNVVNPDFTPTTLHRLIAKVPNTASYDWKAFGDYLWYDQGHFLIGSIWRNPTATDSELKTEVDNTIDQQSGTLILSGWVPSSSEAWTYAPNGVSASTPNAMSGVQFSVESKTISSTWTLTYSMVGLSDGDIVTHNAGKVEIGMQVVNPYNSESPTLDRAVAEAYVRLHLYVWPAVYSITETQPWHENNGTGWTYSAFPYCYTEGKEIAGLRDFWGRQTLIPATETYTSASTTILKGTSASTGQISTSLTPSGSATWQWYNNQVFDRRETDAQRKSALMSFLSDHEVSMPFTFRSPGNVTRSEWSGNSSAQSDMSWNDSMITKTYYGLDTVLGKENYYRQSERVLYYDPTGTTLTYTYPGEYWKTTDKLFVFHLAERDGNFDQCYYFDPSFGF